VQHYSNRRRFLGRAVALGAATSLAPLLNACGSGSGSKQGSAATAAAAGAATPAPKGEKIRIGIIPLTDNASVVMAHELGLYAKQGVNVEVVKEASWANIRDKLLSGELHATHCLFGMPFSVYTDVGGPAGKELLIAMILNNNGQAITLAKDFCGTVPYGQIEKVSAAVEGLKAKKTVTFAMTFPGGTHDLWLRYWLAAAGVDQSTVKIITIPPPQMVANMKVGNMDGFCVGEPWNGVAVQENIGFTHIVTQDLWQHHPEKALVVNKEFAQNRRDDLKGVMRAVLESSAWLDVPDNRRKAAEVIGRPAYVNASADVIDDRLMGRYALGCDYGSHTYTDDTMLFSRGGLTNVPRKAHAIWFMTQYVRFGYLKELPEVAKIADTLVLSNLYAEVAKEMKLAVPTDDMKPFTVKLDNVTFDPNDPAGYLKAVGIRKAA
jgi:nitrate/nitrite transport system substrate-binding protein